jgi:hypothetical protein
VQYIAAIFSSYSAIRRAAMPHGFHFGKLLECRFAQPPGRTLRYPFLSTPREPETSITCCNCSTDRDPRTIIGQSWWVQRCWPCIVGFVVRAFRPSPEEVERRRRERLATTGRITDGVIVDARTLSGEDSVSPTPEVLVYSYRLAGVTYNCAQDVSRLPEQVRGFRIDQPVQVRYDQRNPGNSVLVSESWTGLWQK